MKKIVNNYQYPCTRNIGIEGFGAFLEKEIGKPRRNIRLFAKEFGEVIGLQENNLVMVNSGSSANLVAALAMAEKCRRNGKALTAAASAFTFPTTMSALILAGFNVTLIDVDELGFNISVNKLNNFNEKFSVIAATHFLGFPADLRALREYCDKNGSYLLQDACETLDSRIDGKPLHTFGDIVTWSFYHPHHLSAYGGGAVYGKSKDDYILLDSIAHWGRACKCHIDENLCNVPLGPAHQFTYENIGVNVEISELNACFGRWQLLDWETIENQRKENFAILKDMLKDCNELKVWDFYNDRKDSPFVFPILCKSKTVNEIYEIMSARGIEIRTLMGGATNKQKAFEKYGSLPCPNAEYMSEHAFFVGIHHTLSKENVKEVGRNFLEVFG